MSLPGIGVSRTRWRTPSRCGGPGQAAHGPSSRRTINVFGGSADTSINEPLDRGYTEDGYRGAIFRAGESFMTRNQHWVAAQLFMRATQRFGALLRKMGLPPS
jgi:hypothetical protein